VFLNILQGSAHGGRQCPALNSTAQHQTKTDSSAQHKNTPEIFVNMKIIVAILKLLNKIYVFDLIISPAINFMACTAVTIRNFKMAIIIFMLTNIYTQHSHCPGQNPYPGGSHSRKKVLKTLLHEHFILIHFEKYL
jgi:hypothetical protein